MAGPTASRIYFESCIRVLTSYWGRKETRRERTGSRARQEEEEEEEEEEEALRSCEEVVGALEGGRGAWWAGKRAFVRAFVCVVVLC